MATDITIAGTSIDYQDFEVEIPTSPVDIAPSATVETNATESISANDTLQITIDGTTRFEGRTRSGGTTGQRGNVRVEAAHPVRELMEESVTIDLATPTPEQVLSAALSDANSGGSFTLDYAGTASALNDDYSVADRTVKRVFRDMTDRTDRVWWTDPAGSVIHVEPRGYRGTWQAIDTQQDSATLQRWDSGSVDTVRNEVTVYGTGAVKVEATFEDATSISTYGRRPAEQPYKVSYISSVAEAEAMADQLLIPDPLPEGTLLVGSNVGDITQPLANYTIDISDPGKNVDADTLLVESQTIRQGRATLQFGGGQGTTIESRNRETKSREDNAPAGTVMPSERIADDAINTDKIEDRAIDNQKIELSTIIAENLADSAVKRQAIADAAINGDKVETGSIGATRLFIEDWIPIGLELTDNDPTTGEISWNAHSLVYEGKKYDIQAGSTSDKYVYWNYGSNSYSNSQLKPSLGEDDALVAINQNGAAAPVLQATEIHGGALRTGTITAAEIEAATITADLIDVLNLDTADLTVSDDPSNPTTGFEFGVDSGTGRATFEPINATDSQIGRASNPQGAVFTEVLRADDANIGRLRPLGGPLNVFDLRENTLLDWTVLEPDTDNTGQLGSGDGTSANKAFAEVHTHNLYEYSPQPLSPDDGRADSLADVGALDFEEFKRSTWDDPPGYVSQRSTGEGFEPLGDGDEKGVEMGHMLNYVFEVCKSQQERIEDLEDTVASLEQRLSRLEEQV